MCANNNIEADTKQNHLISKPNPGLYIVSTPIGNLKDITFRAIEVLKASDSIICEDTRVTGKLLSHYGINNKLITYNDHNAPKVRASIIKKLEAGEVLSLVSDAGTPLISDPGYKLVRELKEAEVSVYTIPGPSAVISALSISGFPTDKFYFYGFLPDKKDAQATALEKIKEIDATIVFYLSPKKVASAVKSIESVIGSNRNIAIARELTKKFEEVISGNIEEIKTYLSKGELKGEIVLLLSPPERLEVDKDKLDKKIKQLLEIKGVKDIAALVHEDFGGSKKEIYDRVVELKNGKNK